MVFDDIEQLKRDWTDKYVVVDARRPELRRFEGQTGTVKTVNMSGRALVQFDAYSNSGWYDIDVAYLKVIDAPLPKPEAKETKKAEKPAAKAPPAAKPAAEAKPAASGGKSVADILAAARGGAEPAAPAAESKPAPGKMSTADILAAARGKGGGAPAAKAPAEEKPVAKPAAAAPASDPKKMSVADILAAARSNKPAAPAAEKPAPAPVAEKPAAKPPVAEKPAPAAAPPAEPAAPAAGSGSKKDAFKTVDQIVAYCRKTDGK
jgi:hypothetical protein